MRFPFLKFKLRSRGVVISYASSNEVAGLIFGKRAIFYYPPGCKKGGDVRKDSVCFTVLLFGLVAYFYDDCGFCNGSYYLSRFTDV